eukprot:g16123.t1
MSIESGNVTTSPDWESLSKELQDLVTQDGQLTFGGLMTRYQAMNGRKLDLHGHKLRDSLTNGNLNGLLFNTTNHTLEIGIEPAPKLRALVSSKGPLPMNVVAKRYRGRRAEGLRYNEVSGEMELDDTLCLDAGEPGAPPPAPQPALQAEVPAGAADAIAPPADIMVTAEDAIAPPADIMVTADPAPAMATERLATLDGHQLGSELGVFSLIKPQIVGPLRPKAIIFDVVTLNRTHAGQALVHNQLCPLIADAKTTKGSIRLQQQRDRLAAVLRRRFYIHQVLDLQLAFEDVHGRIGVDAVEVMRAFGREALYGDAASRAIGFDEDATARRPWDTSTLRGAAMACQINGQGSR